MMEEHEFNLGVETVATHEVAATPYESLNMHQSHSIHLWSTVTSFVIIVVENLLTANKESHSAYDK